MSALRYAVARLGADGADQVGDAGDAVAIHVVR